MNKIESTPIQFQISKEISQFESSRFKVSNRFDHLSRRRQFAVKAPLASHAAKVHVPLEQLGAHINLEVYFSICLPFVAGFILSI